MAPLVDEVGHKAAGQLIRSADWNALVAAVDQLDATLGQRIDDLQSSTEDRFGEVTTRLDGLTAALEGVRTELGNLRDEIEPLIGQYYRVTLETTKVNYAFGELAEIVARVTDVRGRPLDLNDTNRPWIDFVTGWGQLRPVGGFEVLGGVGDRAISVRTNRDGIARVLLRTEHAEDLTEEIEDDVAGSLQTKLTATTNVSLADTVLTAATPLEAKPAFRALSIEYDRTDAVGVRTFVDKYYQRYAPRISDAVFIPPISHRWRDYRTTVLALVKSDSDPRTPDQSRAVSSIQVTFRDWIGPWITLDYLAETGPLVQDFRDRLIPKVTNDLRESVTNFKDEVNDLVRDKGLVAKQRGYQVARAALDQVTVPRPPDFLPSLTKSVLDAVNVQQTLDLAQSAAIGAPQERVAFDVFTDAAVRADAGTEGVRSDLAALSQRVDQATQQVGQVASQVNGLQTSVGALGGRLDATVGENGALRGFQARLDTVTEQVQVLRDLDPSRIQTQLIQIDGLNNRLSRLERGNP